MNPLKTPKRVFDPFRRGLNWLYYFAGCTLYALSVDVFTAPNHLVPGGATGLATLVHYLLPAFPIGVGIVLINLPLLWAAWRHIGRDFTIRTAIVTVLSSLMIDLLALVLPTYTGDSLLASLFGGALAGVGVGLVLMGGATTGGSEIAAMLLEKRYPHLSIGRLIFLVDGIIIALAAIVLQELEAALYAGVLVFVSSTVTDELMGGMRRGRAVLIVCREGSELTEALTHSLRRGVTQLNVTGGYTGEPRQLLLCAVRPSEVHPLRLLVDQIDPQAFVMVLTSDEVLGKGFQSLHPKM